MLATEFVINEQIRHFQLRLNDLNEDQIFANENPDNIMLQSKISAFPSFATIFDQELFINKDVAKAKNAAYNAAISRQFSFHCKEFLHSGPLSTALFAIFPLLSDCQTIINDMKNWKGMHDHELVKKGSVWYMLRALLAGDEELAHFHYEKTGKHAYKKLVAYHIERRCLKAILDKDAPVLQAAIYEFLEPQIHKKFLDRTYTYLSNYFYSAHAMIYIKLAHQFNLQVNVEHELVPQALVPFQPLDNYELLYEFMKRSS